jgi:hypothetical protein
MLPKGYSFDKKPNIYILSDNIVIFLITNSSVYNKYLNLFNYLFQNFFKKNLIKSLAILKSTFGDGALYLRGLFIIFFVDAIVIDDEPL